jgi:phosphoribosylaminoimidazole-succinocarboxamide synthase
MIRKVIPLMKRRRIFEGKAKVMFEGPEPGTLVQYFKDDTSSQNGKKKSTIDGKGVLNNRISEYLMLTRSPCSETVLAVLPPAQPSL